MKEVTYEDWKKNSTPRMMWVWNDNVNNKIKMKVVYILKDTDSEYTVLTVINECIYETYKHCAEIEESKTRRMTNKELSRWLREKPTREWKYWHASYVYSFYPYFYSYTEREADEEICEKILIREDDGEWREPLVEE